MVECWLLYLVHTIEQRNDNRNNALYFAFAVENRVEFNKENKMQKYKCTNKLAIHNFL